MTCSTEDSFPRPTSARGPQQPVYRWDTGRRRSDVPHVQGCQCRACLSLERANTQEAVILRENRKARATDDPGERWDVAVQRLVAYLRTHVQTRNRGKPQMPEIRDAWLNYLDATSLIRGLAVLESYYPLWARLIRGYFYGERTMAELGEAEHLHPVTVGKNLRRGLIVLYRYWQGLDRIGELTPTPAPERTVQAGPMRRLRQRNGGPRTPTP